MQDQVQSKGEEGFAEVGSAVCSLVVRRNRSTQRNAQHWKNNEEQLLAVMRLKDGTGSWTTWRGDEE